MGRAPCCDKANVKKGPWSPEEDAKLKEFIDKYGTAGNWIALPQKAGLKRCGKSCRLRWLNYLRPNIKHGEFTTEEDRIICSLYASIGSRWSIIAAQLPGRTDNDIKNYWNTKLKKKLLGNMMITSNHQPKFPPQFSFNISQTSSIPQSLSTLSQLYNSLYNQASKSLTHAIDHSSTTPQSFLYCNSDYNYNNHPPLFTTQNPYYQQNYQEGFMDNLQYCPMKDNMLMFGGNEASCSNSSDGSCSHGKDQVKQEEMGCFHQGLISNHRLDQNQKFMLDDPLRSFLDQKANGVVENSELQYDIEEVKQLITTTGDGCNNNVLFNDEMIKTEERAMYYY